MRRYIHEASLQSAVWETALDVVLFAVLVVLGRIGTTEMGSKPCLEQRRET